MSSAPAVHPSEGPTQNSGRPGTPPNQSSLPPDTKGTPRKHIMTDGFLKYPVEQQREILVALIGITIPLVPLDSFFDKLLPRPALPVTPEDIIATLKRSGALQSNNTWSKFDYPPADESASENVVFKRFGHVCQAILDAAEVHLGKGAPSSTVQLRPDNKWAPEVLGNDFKVDGEIVRQRLDGQKVYSLPSDSGATDAANVICNMEFKKQQTVFDRRDVSFSSF